MTESRASLKELQELDQEIALVRDRIGAFAPELESIEAKGVALEGEIGTLEKRLTESKVEERRLEVVAETKRERIGKLGDRLTQVRTVREEAAVNTELDMVKRSLESDEQDVYTLIDQIRRMEERLAEMTEAFTSEKDGIEPRKLELLTEQKSAQKKFDQLTGARDGFAESIDERERAMYERIKMGGRDTVVASMTQDGACGSCFQIIPLQIQSVIRNTETLVRCEGCGVIVMPPDLEAEAAAAEAAEERAAAVKEAEEATKEATEADTQETADAEAEGETAPGSPLLDALLGLDEEAEDKAEEKADGAKSEVEGFLAVDGTPADVIGEAAPAEADSAAGEESPEAPIQG